MAIAVVAIILFVVVKKVMKLGRKAASVISIGMFLISAGFITVQDVKNGALATVSVVQEYANKAGIEGKVKVENDEVFFRSSQTNNEWVNLSKSEIVGPITDTVNLRVNGKEYKVADSGIVNVIKILEGKK